MSSDQLSSNQDFISSDAIRHSFSLAMSKMYQTEVPLYTDLMELVAEVNEEVLSQQPEIATQLKHTHDCE